MAKYLSFTTGDGTEYVNADGILYCDLSSATAVHLYELTGGKKVALTTVGATQAFIDSIQAALKTAAETSWTNAVVPVANTGVTSITSIVVS